MRVVDGFLIVLGALVVWIVASDLFVSAVVPRPAPGIRPSSILVRNEWWIWRGLTGRLMSIHSREAMLGRFAPFALLTVLVFWALGLVLGFGLILYGLRSQIEPMPGNLGEAIYSSAVSLVIGAGDYHPTGGVARLLALIEAGVGLGLVAMMIALLFSLYASFQRREVLVVTLDALAGAPPSGVVLLENSKRLGLMEHLDDVLDEWKVWAAEVLESHLAYPILNYFRSSHDNESWISALGAVLDASTLLLTTLEEGPQGAAKLTYQVGTHLTEDLSHLFGFAEDHDPGVERFEWDQARERLAEAGYRLRPADVAWPDFVKKRAQYALALNAMARHWAIPPAQWIGDRSPVRYRLAVHPERAPARTPEASASRR